MLSLKLFEAYFSCDAVFAMTHHLPKLWAPLQMTSRAKTTGYRACRMSCESDCRVAVQRINHLKSHLRNKVRTIIDIEFHSRFLENHPSHSTWATGRNHRNYSKPGTMRENLLPSQDIFLSDLFYSESRSQIVKSSYDKLYCATGDTGNTETVC